MSQFRLHDPWWLLLLVILAACYLWRKRACVEPASVTYSSLSLLDGVPRSWLHHVHKWLSWLRHLSVICLVVALARPQLGLQQVRLNTDGIAIVMCIDRSGSMNAMDFELDGKRVNRLEVVKRVFRDFVVGKDQFQGRSQDLVGLVAFGGFAESKCPPTLDHQTLTKILETVTIPQPIVDDRGRVMNEQLLAEEQATAIGDALGVAVDRLKDLKVKSKIILLLSDGESNAGVLTPEEGSQAASGLGIKVYCIGVGTNGRAPFLMSDPFGRQFLQNQLVRLDEAALRKIADATGGKYFNAQDTLALRQVYEEIDQLEKTETEGKVYVDYQELYGWPLSAAVLLIVIEILLTSTRFRTIP